MSSSVFTNRNTGMCCSDLDIEMRISDRISYLLKCSACSKHCKAGYERDLSCCSHTCRNTHHISLSNSAVKKPVGKLLFKDACLCSCCKVCIKYIKVIVNISKLSKSITIAFSCSDLFNLCHCLTLQFLQLCSKLRHCLFILFLVRCSSVPRCFIFHK